MARRRHDLRREFDGVLWDAWLRWDEYGAPADSSPFWDLDDIPELDDDSGYNHMVGWLRGVADATGWSLDRPTRRPLRRGGVKEWQPPLEG